MHLQSWSDPFASEVAQPPPAADAATSEPLYEVSRVFFAAGSSTLEASDRERLDEVVFVYRALLATNVHPLRFLAIGFADRHGATPAHVGLARRRALAVATYVRRAFEEHATMTRLPIEVDTDVRGDDPDHGPRDLTHAERLASWQRVSLYANASGAEVQSAIPHLREALHESASRVVSGRARALSSLQSVVIELQHRTHDDELPHAHGVRLDAAQLYRSVTSGRADLLRAIDQGDAAVLRWLRTRGPSYETNARDLAASYRRAARRLRGIASSTDSLESAGYQKTADDLEMWARTLLAELDEIVH